MSEYAPTLSEVRGWIDALARWDVDASDHDKVEALGELERLKSSAAAAQARITDALDRSQRAAQRAAGVPEREVGRGIAAQVALARRDGSARGSRHLGLAQALVREMPHTLRALESGDISEWRATLLVRETACLSRQDRRAVDAELGAMRGGLAALGDGETVHAARRIAYRIDPQAVVARGARAEAQRRVTIRPAPDTMALLAGLLPAAQGVAVFTALTRHADSLRSSGDARSRGQIMADTLVERVTGQATASGVPVEVSVVMTDAGLLDGDDGPAFLEGVGPVPAAAVRRWLRDLPDAAAAWVRRLYVEPATQQLVAMDSRRRCFAGGLRRFVVLRDQVCRTPWCSAPIRQVDHVRRATDGGVTEVDNAQGLCEACNGAKEAVGWTSRAAPDGSVETRSPTGHVYRSHPPPVPVWDGRPPLTSRADVAFAHFVLTA